MVFTACTYLALAGAAWILLRLLQACFWLPRHLKQQNSMQKMLQDKVDGYEKYILECEEKEREAAEVKETDENTVNEEGVIKQTIPIDEKKWKERRECLEMLKKELKRVSDGGDPYDWDHLLEEDEDEKEEISNKEDNKDHNTKEESLDNKENLNEKADVESEKNESKKDK